MAFRQLIAGRLSERNTLVWLAGTIACLGLWACPRTFTRIAAFLGIEEAPILPALLSAFILLGLVLQHAVELSLLQGRLRELAQQLAILQQQHSCAQPDQGDEPNRGWNRAHGGGRLGE